MPCGIHALCVPEKSDPERKFKCTCKKGHKGNPYSNGKDKCKSKEEIYLEKLFGYYKCHGCKLVRGLRSIFKHVKGLRVLDFGTGSCESLRAMLKLGMNATGVESAAFSLDDNCPDLVRSGHALKAKFDDLPFQNATFDLVFVSHVLEYMPKDLLDSVIAEVSRVAKLHVFFAVQTPDEKKSKHTKVVDGLELESYFSNLWWRERLAAGGLDLMDIETHMFLEHAKKKAIKLDAHEVAMVLAREPPENSREFPLIHKVYCLACDYMPLVSYMYSPPVTVSQSRYRKKLTMGDTLVLGPSSCNVMRGLLENPPASLNKVVALQPVQYTISRDCPDLSRQRLVLPMPPANETLPFREAQADLILSLFHLELMNETEIDHHLEELKRITDHRIFFLIHTCGTDVLAPNCVANAIPGIVTIKPRKWWNEVLASHGFQREDISHAMQKRQCRTIDNGSGGAGAAAGSDPPSSRMGYCDSVLEELSALSTYELKARDIFPVSVKSDPLPLSSGQGSGEVGGMGALIKGHKAVEREAEGVEGFVNLADFREQTEVDPIQMEVKLSSDKHRSKHFKQEQKIRERLKKAFPDAPPAPRTAHIYTSRGYNIKSARTQVDHHQHNQGETDF